jgi:elongation factor P--(R)-beta-lysine ligase
MLHCSDQRVIIMNRTPNWKKLQNGHMNWDVFRTRSLILSQIRHYFDSNHFLEIEAPILTPYPTLDNNIESIDCMLTGPDDSKQQMFLHSSPEHAMKKCLAGGSGDIYSLGKVFRNREITQLHNPEFTLAEWYRMDSDYRDIMRDMQNLIGQISRCLNGRLSITYQGHSIDLNPPWTELSVADAFRENLGLNTTELLDQDSLRKKADENGIYFSPDDGWETLFHRLFMEKIEPFLGLDRPVFIKDFPAEMGLMAKCRTGDPEFVERVELYISGIELANGYSELTDPEAQTIRFLTQHKIKEQSGFTGYPIDYELIQALHDLTPCSGVALGVDRLIMLFLNKTDIRDVILFPLF